MAMRRWLLTLVALFGVATSTVGSVSAQNEPPADSSYANQVLSTYGLSEIVLDDTGDGLINPPAELEAGRYLITIQAQPDIMTYVNFVQAPAGFTHEELKQQFLDAAGSDVVSPGWLFAGGSSSIENTSPSFVVDLAEGDWYIGASHIVGEADEVPELYPLKVTAATNDQVEDLPAADVNVKMSDMKYTIAETTIKTGPQSWEFTSDSTQSHHVVIARTTGPVTPDEVEAWAQGMFTGTPTPNSKMDGMEWVGYTALLSGGQTVRTEFDFDPGNYVLICFIFDPETQMPHLMHGMSTPFVVE
jgi:plastocyanin